jgi:hypothetical protein
MTPGPLKQGPVIESAFSIAASAATVVDVCESDVTTVKLRGVTGEVEPRRPSDVNQRNRDLSIEIGLADVSTTL